jgi:hypothetical protein
MLRTRSYTIFLFLFLFFPSFIFFSYGCREFSNGSIKVGHYWVWRGKVEAKLYPYYPYSQLMSNKILVKIVGTDEANSLGDTLEHQESAGMGEDRTG